MTGYGEIRGTVSIAGNTISVTGEGDVIKYRREWRGGEYTRLLVRPRRLELVPMYPVLLPKKITNYVMVRLLEPIHIPSRGEAMIYIKIPVELAVMTYDRYRRYDLVDVFPVMKIKYVLYGSPDRGLIARYWESVPMTDPPDTSIGEARVLVNIRSRYDGWVEIGRILLDSQILKLYYVPGTWRASTQAITMVVNSPATATIYYGRKVEMEARPVHDPPGLRPPRILARTEMLYGLR